MRRLAAAVHLARAYGLRKVARRLFATYVKGQHRAYLVRSDYVAIAAMAVPDTGLTFRCARAEDVPALARGADMPVTVLQAWLDRGDFFYVALRDGQPVAFRSDSTTVVTPWVRPVLRLPPDQVFMVDIVTLPTFRQQGITRQIRVATAREMVQRGFRGAWGLQRPLNRKALAAFDRTPEMLERFALLTRTSRLGSARFGLTVCHPLSAHPVGHLLDVVRALVPQARRVAVLFNPGTRVAHAAAVATVRREAASRSVDLQLVGVTEAVAQTEAFREGFGSILACRPDAMIVVDDALLREHCHVVVELAGRHRVPAVYERPEYVRAGGLASGSQACDDATPLPAELNSALLRLEPPATGPFPMAVNLTAARNLGLAVPESLVRRAELVPG